MQKREFLTHWKGITEGQTIPIQPVPYKHKGSTYAQDGIRITGSPEFIDAVLSRIKDMLQHENGSTRLQVNYQQSVDKDTGQTMDSYNCYIQVHQRGREARIMNMMFESVGVE